MQITHNKANSDKYQINRYSTTFDLKSYGEELDEALNPSFCGFFTVSQTGFKRGKTELSIVGSLLKMIRASMLHGEGLGCRVRFTKADLSRICKVSERTIQRYLGLVLDKMGDVYGIHYEIVNGRHGGVTVWTEELDHIERQGERMFDPSLVSRCRRKNDSKRAEAVALAKRKGDKTQGVYHKSKGRSKNNGGKLAKVMIKLSANLLRSTNLPAMSRLNLDNEKLLFMLARLLAKGHWRHDALAIVKRAMITTDMALSDFTILNPAGYLQGVISTASKAYKIPTQDELKRARLKFWNDELNKYLDMIKLLPDLGKGKAHERTMEHFKTKLAT